MPRKNSISNLILVIIILILLLLLLFGGFWIYDSAFNEESNDEKLTVNIDETVIVTEVKKLNILNTIEVTNQREFEFENESNDLEVFGLPILESFRSQKFIVNVKVTAGVDLSQLKEEDVQIDNQNQVITLQIPASQVTSVSLIEDKIYLLDDQSSFLYNVQNLNTEVNKSRTEKLQKDLISNGRTAGLDGACEDDILEKASENAEQDLQQILSLIPSDYTIQINSSTAEECSFSL